MLFRLVNSEYDSHTGRGYVEFRANDDDGGEIVIATILSFRFEIQNNQARDQARDCTQGSLCAKKGCASNVTSEAYRDPWC
jgi:cell fate regulator YaaT (PSP1 superfamily)